MKLSFAKMGKALEEIVWGWEEMKNLFLDLLLESGVQKKKVEQETYLNLCQYADKLESHDGEEQQRT